MRMFATVLVALATALASVAQAQDFPIRVGRIAYLDGRVSLYQDPDAGWEEAWLNSPITSENSVWADEGSRAEVRISSVAIRLDRLTQLDVASLEEEELDAYVPRGTVAVRVRHFQREDRLVFTTPNTRVRLLANGRYRIDVDPDNFETRVTVFSGEARIGGEDGRMRVGAGRSVVVFGSDPPEFFEEAARSDAFDRWTLARDETWREGKAPTYVSPYMTGYEDLDTYGQWANEPDYGVLWYPTRVAADWAPYRYGRWDYVRPWGWTWVDDAPWGYAPFHYGRWVYVRNRWAWHPGERIARPAWAPALVAWVGGSNFNVGVSTGPAVGWYPLSPWDRYDPWFNASPTYVNRVNVIVRPEPARQDRRDWHRSTRERGTTVVSRRALVDRQNVRQALVPITQDVVRQVQAAPRPEAVLPSRNDVLQRRREQPRNVAAPVARATQRAQPGAPAQAGRSSVARPDFGRGAVVATPRPASEASRAAQRANARATPGAERAAPQQAQPQQQQQQRQAQERAQREQQQAQERAQQQQRQAQEQAQREQQQQRQAQERAAREQQQAQDRAAREAQQQQRQAQERAQREQQQAQERAQQQQRQAQERAQREQQQARERAAREAQQQQQRQAQERAQREQQQAQERAQQQQRQAQERAQREQQQQQQAQERARQQQRQAQERAQREQQQAQERARQQQRQAQEQAQREQQQAKERAEREQSQRAPGKGRDQDEERGRGR